MASLVLDGDDGTGGVVEELVGDLRKHDGTSAACKPAAAHELTRESVGLGPAATRTRTGRRAREDGGGPMGDEDEHRSIRICAAADRRRRASRPLGCPSRLPPIRRPPLSYALPCSLNASSSTINTRRSAAPATSVGRTWRRIFGCTGSIEHGQDRDCLRQL